MVVIRKFRQNYIKCVENAFFVENIQKSFNNWKMEASLLIDGWHLVPPLF